jgi:hypothetical protein
MRDRPPSAHDLAFFADAIGEEGGLNRNLCRLRSRTDRASAQFDDALIREDKLLRLGAGLGAADHHFPTQ